ncbi:MAG: hypothetical protein R2844_14070 [Caldilineales bacterium]
MLLNAAMGLAVPDGDWRGGLERKRQSIDSGAPCSAGATGGGQYSVTGDQ